MRRSTGCLTMLTMLAVVAVLAITCAGATNTLPTSPSLAAHPALAETRKNGLAGIAAWANSSYGQNCVATAAWLEFHGEAVPYDFDGSVVDVHEPCNMVSSLQFFDAEIKEQGDPSFNTGMSLLALGSAFYHATS